MVVGPSSIYKFLLSRNSKFCRCNNYMHVWNLIHCVYATIATCGFRTVPPCIRILTFHSFGCTPLYDLFFAPGSNFLSLIAKEIIQYGKTLRKNLVTCSTDDRSKAKDLPEISITLRGIPSPDSYSVKFLILIRVRSLLRFLMFIFTPIRLLSRNHSEADPQNL